MNNTHPRTQASSWSIENSPFRVRAVLRLMFHLWRKTPCLCGGVYSVLIQMGLPHENPLKIYAGRNVYGYFFLHCSFIRVPGRVLAFHQHIFFWTHLSFPLRLQFELAGLSLLSGQVRVGEDIIVNMGNWLMSNYNLVQISLRLISLDKPRL